MPKHAAFIGVKPVVSLTAFLGRMVSPKEDSSVPSPSQGIRFIPLAIFILFVVAAIPSRAETLPESIEVRGDLSGSQTRFQSGSGTVAFMGGSITEMNGYRPMVVESLRRRFPETEFEFINAGISSTCSHTGAFRLERDVLSKQPDLLLVEFAVNDDQDAAHSYQDALRGMEGIIRAARLRRPQMDILMVHFVNESMLETTRQRKTPVSIAAHSAVADHYGVSTCNVAVELAKQIESGDMTWEVYGGVHPKQPGNRVAADLVDRVFDELKFDSDPPDRSKHVLADRSGAGRREVPAALDPHSFFAGRFLAHDSVELAAGWDWTRPDWSAIPGSFRSRYADRDLLVSGQPGAVCEFQFEGQAFGVFVLAGPDAGIVEYSVGGGPWKTRDLYHRYSRGLHYPRTIVLESGLPNETHQVRLRVSKQKNDASTGHAIRILEVTAS